MHFLCSTVRIKQISMKEAEQGIAGVYSEFACLLWFREALTHPRSLKLLPAFVLRQHPFWGRRCKQPAHVGLMAGVHVLGTRSYDSCSHKVITVELFPQ